MAVNNLTVTGEKLGAVGTPTATQQSGAAFNRRLVLDIVRRDGPLARADICARVDLSPQAVANITGELQQLGLLTASRVTERKGRGQPPIAFALDPAGGDAIGFSLEPNRVSSALVNLVGDVLARAEARCDTGQPHAVLAIMIEQAAALRACALDPKRLWGIGVALPGPFDVPGMSFVGPTAFEGWSDLAPLAALQDATGLPVFYNTDSVAGALGEMLFGVAARLDDFFYLHLGVGLGGVLIGARTAYRGANGNATEIGHIPAVPHGRACYCGSHGCLERYLSLHALAEHLHGPDAPELTTIEIEGLIARDDPALIDWTHQATSHLRAAVCTIENLFDPQAIVIGGSAPRALSERLLVLAQPFRPSVRRDTRSPRVLLTGHADDSALLGAAVLPIHELLSPRLDAPQRVPAHHPAHRALVTGANLQS